jgi:hypothetical protein
MTGENLVKYNAMVERINAMTAEQVDKLVAEDRCPFEPEHMIGVPLGMFHCDVCGEMVVAGVGHPRRMGEAEPLPGWRAPVPEPTEIEPPTETFEGTP